MVHIMEMFGMARVVVKDGKIIEISQPEIEWCPIFDKSRGVKHINVEEVRKNIEFRMQDFGLFTSKRKLDMDVFVGFGATEIMMSGLNRGLIDTTVTVCDGAGTVITSNPKLVQGMGARISGLIQTEPIIETIDGINQRNGVILDQKNATIDPVAGVKKAIQMGYKKIAVSVVDAVTALKLKELEKINQVNLTIIAAHTTGISMENAQLLINNVDIITSCASKQIREIIKPLIQVGTAVPLFGMTQKGKELLLERAKEIKSPILINTMDLPVLPEKKQPKNIK